MILLAANWKENPKSEKAADQLFKDVAKIIPPKGAMMAIFPPFIYLEKIVELRKKLKKKIPLGAQDVFWEEDGPFTGEVSPEMLTGLGMQYAIIGHSERRKWLKETDAMVNKKIKAALAAGLKVILCVGEPMAVRKKGEAAAMKFVGAQLAKGLKGIAPKHFKKSVTIAYEPIWAIGTGRASQAVDAVLMAEFIKAKAARGNKASRPAVLYGGSVNAKNIADFVQYKSIDGALVGGASLKAREFKKMMTAVAAVVRAAQKN